MRDLITGLRLARGDANQVKEPVRCQHRLDEESSSARASEFPTVKFAADLEQTTVSGVPER